MSKLQPEVCPISGCTESKRIFQYDSPPTGEVQFSRLNGQAYCREVWQFETSRHFVSVHNMDLGGLYEGEYNQSNYIDSAGMRKTFERITGLPPEGSDNTGRVRRIESFWQQRYDSPPATQRRLLDIGSGLAVFPFAMKNHGWLCTALDPDPVAVQHAREVAGVDGICGAIENAEIETVFNLITLNKVLEHVPDPIAMLSRCKQLLDSNGLIYIEVPDGEMASIDGKGREEFFIDHFHIFSFASLALLASRAGFVPVHIERLQEPSTKYTLRAFLEHP